MIAFKSTLFFIFVPCLLLGVLPYWLMLNTTAILDLGTWRWTAILLWFNGIWITILLGYAIWWPSLSLLMAPLLFLLATHLFVVFYEEPVLRKKFGAAYEQYCRDVPRWGRLFGKRI
jgi:hypothetical protein